jgi:hypothetical protein
MNTHVPRFHFFASCIGLLHLLGVAPSAPGAASTTWQLAAPATGNWFDATNWSAGVPTSTFGETEYIDNGGSAQVSSGTANWDYLQIGFNSTGHLVHAGGNGSGRYLSIGYNANAIGTYAISTGSIAAGSSFDIGFYGDGTVTQTGGNISSFAATLGYYTGKGHYFQSGGLLSVDGVFVANGSGSQADYSLSGSGQIHASGTYYSSLWVGRYGSGVFTQTGGSATLSQDVYVGEQSGAHGEYTISAGTLNFGGKLRIADSGQGKFAVIGSTPVITGNGLQVGNQGTLLSEINGSGLSALNLTGSAVLGGSWIIQDLGAGYGRFDVVKSNSITGTFNSITLPGIGWSWGIDGGKTLWVSHVPECSSIVLVIIGLIVAPISSGRKRVKRVILQR